MQHAYLSNYNANQGSNYGRMSCDPEQKKKKLVTYHILRWSAFF